MSEDDVFFLIVGGLGVASMTYIAWRAHRSGRAVQAESGRLPRRIVFFWCLRGGAVVLYLVSAIPLVV